MKKQPVIIIGMHRSGTSMLTRFISDLGVFMGCDRSENDESEYFQNLNRWILYQAGALWDNPYPIDLIDIINKRMSSFSSYSYLGLRNFVFYRDVRNLSISWGWKDPRNSLLLAIYKTVFPDAKIIHIYRNPIDVALSLQKREKESKEISKKNFKNGIKAKFLIYQRFLNHSFAVEDLNNGINLWEFYTKKALEADKLFDKTLHIKYEDFLNKPTHTLRCLTNFLGLEINSELISNVSNKVNPKRAFSFINNSEHIELYNEIKTRPLMTSLGYDKII